MMRRTDRPSRLRFTSAARKASAHKKLGVSAEQVSTAARITPFLKDTRGSLKPILEAMRFSRDPVVVSFVAKYDSLGLWARTNITWEAIALGAGLSLPHLLGAALLAERAYGIMKAQLRGLSRYEDVMEKRIEFAMRPGGWRDRDAIDKFLGIHPIDWNSFRRH